MDAGVEQGDKILRLAFEWRDRLLLAQSGHYVVAEKMQRRSLYLGVVSILLTMTLTSVVFYKPIHGDDLFSLCIAAISVFSGVISTVITFYRPSERAEIHRQQAARYGALRRRVERIISCAEYRALSDSLADVQKCWDSIAQDSPLTPKSAIDKASNFSGGGVQSQ